MGNESFDELLNEFLKDFQINELTEQQCAWWETNMVMVMKESTNFGSNALSAGMILAQFTRGILGKEAFNQLHAYTVKVAEADEATRGNPMGLFGDRLPKTPPTNPVIDPNSKLFSDLMDTMKGTDPIGD